MSLSKSKFRQDILSQRRALDASQVASRSANIVANIFSAHFLDAPHIRSIGLYAAKSDEVQTRELFDRLKTLPNHPQLYFPAVRTTGILEYFKVQDWDADLAPAKFGLLEPRPEIQTAKAVPDLLFIPGLAFGADGHRIGYGKGHFDKTFAAWSSAKSKIPLKVGLAFDFQIFPSVPYEATDIPMDWLVSESCAKLC